jgi:pilus assembly protein CpaE
VALSVAIVESAAGELGALARGAGLNATSVDAVSGLASIARNGTAPEVLVIDLRGGSGIPADLVTFKRRFARTGVVVVVPHLDPAMMLEAMRAGVTEVVPEPVSGADLKAAVERVLGQQAPAIEQGKVLGFVGAKGGVGTTTLAVNVAAALAAEPGTSVLLADLHVTGHGDAALFVGVEPRFSVVDALENVHRLDRAVLGSLVVRAKSGMDVLSSPDRPALRQADSQHLRALLDRLSSSYQYVVLDLPRSDLGTIDAIEPIAAMTVVVNQELPTVRRAAQVAALLRQRYGKERVGSVVSRYDARADIGQDDIERVVGLPVWALLPSDYRRTVAAANAGRPLIGEGTSRLGTSIIQFARKLSGMSATEAAPVKRAAPRKAFGAIF